MFKPARALLAAAAVVAMAVPATAQTTDFVPVLTEERTYLLCNGANKVQNQNNPVQWSTAAPTTSYTGGAGCGFADPGLLVNTADTGQADLVMSGTYTGNLDKISVHLHSIDGPATRSGLVPVTVETQVEVDGVIVFDGTATPVAMDPQRSESGATALVQYTVTDINQLAESDLKTHDVIVRVATYYSDDVHGWVWGASEIDSGITFNPTKLSGTRVRAAR